MITLALVIATLIVAVELEGSLLGVIDASLARVYPSELAQRLSGLAGKVLLLLILFWLAPTHRWSILITTLILVLIWRPAFYYLMKALISLPGMKTPSLYSTDQPLEEPGENATDG